MRGASLAFIVALTGLGAWLRAGFVPLHHAMYIDEPWYLEAARHLGRGEAPVVCEQTWRGLACLPYAKALGWPVLLVATSWFQDPDHAAFCLTAALGTLAVPLAAALGFALTESAAAAVCSAALVAVLPLHVAWSATAETNVPGATMLLAALGCWHRAARDGRPATALGAGLLTVWSAAIRPETACLVGFALVLAPAVGRRRWFAWLGVVTLACAWVVRPMWALNSRLSGGGFLHAGALGSSLRVLAREDSTLAVALVLGAGSALGLAALWRGGKRREAVAWGTVATALTVVPLSYDRLMERMLLPALVMACVLSGAAGTLVQRGRGLLLGGAVVLAALIAATPGLVRTRDVSRSQWLESAMPGLVRAHVREPTAWLVTEWPTVATSTTGIPTLSTRAALSRGVPEVQRAAAARPWYFVRDMFCEDGFQGGDNAPPACAQWLRDVPMDEVEVLRDGRRAYGLYRVRGATEPR